MTPPRKTAIIPQMDPERLRLSESRGGPNHWLRWGPYLAERQWATVREDYSPSGNPWDYFTHDMARSRSYRWGEDGIGGISDDQQILCLSIALWNGHDPILKERMFGLTGDEGNHGEDVKEVYSYLDGTPTNSYLRMVYKYPQRAFPYTTLVDGNRQRSRSQPELDLIDTGVFDDQRYFDVFIEYAKEAHDDIAGRITIQNHGPERASLDIVPQLWFRNRWSWDPGISRPRLHLTDQGIGAIDEELGELSLTFDGAPQPLFCDNATNVGRLWGVDSPGWFKDGINDFIVGGMPGAVNPANEGTKAGLRYHLTIEAGGTSVIRFRLAPPGRKTIGIDELFERRKREADQFYEPLTRGLSEDARLIQRQAFAGLIWSRQFYSFDVARWLDGDPGQPQPPAERFHGRNSSWRHLKVAGIYSMPDNWEYPFFAAWDLAFHCVAFATIDAQYAKGQLLQLLGDSSMHPSGQVPGTEWELGDPNPPLQAWAAWKVFEIERQATNGSGDIEFLRRIFPRLSRNFDWWLGLRDPARGGAIRGGFLGLDNISFFDRSAELPGGAWLEQVDAAAWLAMFSLNLLRIALELTTNGSDLEQAAARLLEQFLEVASSLSKAGGVFWDERDRFFYDALHQSGQTVQLPVRSIVGLAPLFASETFDAGQLERIPSLATRLRQFKDSHPEAPFQTAGDLQLLSLVGKERLKEILHRLLDETEFLSPHGLRALSRAHLATPAALDTTFGRFTLSYEPAETTSGDFGRNSNWRGPVWLPVNYLMIESLRTLNRCYGESLTVECPTGSGNRFSLQQIADHLCHRITSLFLRDGNGVRPLSGDDQRLQNNDQLTFPEYFNGDSGEGLGASHQTGWTALVALLLPGSLPASD